MGAREIVRYLLKQGARTDVFFAAMLGRTATVTAMIDLDPATVESLGSHGINLMLHVGYGGKPAMANAVLQHITDRGPQCNRAIHTATLSNHVELVRWLVENGATDINTPNFFGKTPLGAAKERGFDELAELLRQNSGVSTA